jgi:hypothetical protein
MIKQKYLVINKLMYLLLKNIFFFVDNIIIKSF